MSTTQQSQPYSSSTLLASLAHAVQEELEKKRKLGHYYVTDENGRIVFKGDDAPEAETHAGK